MPNLDADAIRTEIAETETDLVLAIQEAEGSALSIPGFEAVLAVTAVKIVIPVLAGLRGIPPQRRLRVRGRRDVDQAVTALADLVAAAPPTDPTCQAPAAPTTDQPAGSATDQPAGSAMDRPGASPATDRPGAAPAAGRPGTSPDQLRRDVVAAIVADGIDAQPADAVVTRTIARLQHRYLPRRVPGARRTPGAPRG